MVSRVGRAALALVLAGLMFAGSATAFVAAPQVTEPTSASSLVEDEPYDPPVVSPGSDEPLTPARDLIAPPADDPTGQGAEQAQGAPVPDHPYGRFLSDIYADGNVTAREVGVAAAHYFHDLGFRIPRTADDAPGDAQFEENSTISYTYAVSDIDGDGVDDVLLDTYCVDFGPCSTGTRIGIGDPQMVNQFLDVPCSRPHRIQAVSGATGEPLWNQSLNRFPKALFTGCSIEFVVGTVSLENTTGVLVYRHETTQPLVQGYAVLVENQFEVLDAATGDRVWSRQIDGFLLDTLFKLPPYTAVAENVLVNPIVQIPPSEGIHLVSEGTEPAVFLQGVGFNLTFVNSFLAPPGFTEIARPLIVLDEYEPNEWAARLDVETGEFLWEVPTFQGERENSLLPVALRNVPYPRFAAVPSSLFFFEPTTTALNYWSDTACCYDTSGDGVPDLPYVTYEWSKTPSYDTDGPYWMMASIDHFDGASGEFAYRQVVEEGTDVPFSSVQTWGWTYSLNFRVAHQYVGDVDGDGLADYAVHAEYDYERGYTHVMSIRSGVDGAEIWRLEGPRAMSILPLGDSDGDGGVDLLLFDWFPSTFWYGGDWHWDNVTKTPISIYRGADGQVLWQTATYGSVRDMLYMFASAHMNGLPDVDADGVADFPVDDPLYLPDQTVVHRQSFLSGRTGQVVWELPSLGAFAFAARAGDVDGDGIEELALLNGDINDQWLTLVDGETGEQLWSRRILALRSSSYALAIPHIHFHALNVANRTGQDIFMNFQFSVLTYGSYISVTATNPQIFAYDGPNGTAYWALPRIWDPNLTFVVQGASPATQMYQQIFDDPPEADEHMAAVGDRVVPAAAGFLAALGLGFGLGARRFRP